MKKVLFFSLISMFTMFYSCKDEPVEVITTSSDALSVKPLFASEVLTISATSAWSASSSCSWCTMSDSVGTTKKAILVSCKENLTGLPREATITVHANKQTKTVIVKQGSGTILLAEDFNDDTNNWIQGRNVAAINSGSLNLKNTSNYDYIFVNSLISEYSSNSVISTKFKVVSGLNPFGVMFGYKDLSNWYALEVFPTGYIGVIQCLNGAQTMIKINETTYFQNQYTVSILKSGNVAYVYLNDDKIISFNYSPFGPYVGFVCFRQTEVIIDYLRINKF